jgi:hypothetical protein
MSKQGRGPSVSGRKRIDPLTVIIRPNSFAPQLFQSSIDVTQAPTSGSTSIIPKKVQPSLFGGSPFESEAVSPPATPGVPSAETAGTTGPRFRKTKKRPQMTASVTAQTPAVIDRIHEKVVGVKESKQPDQIEDPVVEVPLGAPEADAVPFKVVKKRKKKFLYRCSAFNIVVSRLQAWTGLGAGRAWKQLNPISTALAKHLLRKCW